MPLNFNLPVWTNPQDTITGGASGDGVVIPSDIDIIDIEIDVAAATDADIEVAQDPRESIIGINRVHRYRNFEVNDLGATGEFRLDPADGQDFLEDGWQDGDGFFGISHGALDSPYPLATTLLDQFLIGGTVDVASSDALTFATDPAFVLPAAEALLRQIRAAVDDSSLTWGVHSTVSGPTTVIVTLEGVAGKKVRIDTNNGVGDITYTIRGRIQSRDKGDAFVVGAEDHPFAGLPGAVGTFIVGPDAELIWDRAVVDGQGRAVLVESTTDFDSLGVVPYDKLFVRGHSVTGNGGLWTVKSVVASAGGEVVMFEDLRGSIGTDTPGRAQIFRHAATV